MSTAIPPKGETDKRLGAYQAPLSVSAQDVPNMTVKVRAGSFFNSQNEFIEYAGGSTAVIAAPTASPVWVVVALTDAGSLTTFRGAEAASPSLPALPSGVLPIAAVFLTTTTTAIVSPLVVDLRPFLRSVDVVPNLSAELANRPTSTDLDNLLLTKSDTDGTIDAVFTLNKDAVGSPVTNAEISVNRGTSPAVSIRWNESTDVWEFTNDGVLYSAITSATGFAPITHTHVSADVTDLAASVNGLISAATISQSQVTNLVTDLSAKASVASLTTHTNDTSVHFTLPIPQSGVTNLAADLAGKMNLTGGVVTGTVTVQEVGKQPISLVSTDTGSSGMLVDRSSVPGPDARFEWDESADAWLIGTTGSMDTVLTDAVVATKMDVVLPAPVVDTVATFAAGGQVQSSGVLVTDLATNADLAVDLALKVDKAGDTMTGNLAMSGNKVTGLAAGSVAGDAARYDELVAHTGDATIHFTLPIAQSDVTGLDVALSGKVNDVAGVAGNFAALDGTGELVDSGFADTSFSLIGHNHDAAYVNVGGDTMTGTLVLNADPVNPLEASTKQYVDTGLATKANTVHTHLLADVTDVTASVVEVNQLAGVNIATTYETIANVATKAPLASPAFTGVPVMPTYTVGTLPPVGTGGGVIYVSDATGASVTGSLCFSNGTSWIDVTTGIAVV